MLVNKIFHYLVLFWALSGLILFVLHKIDTYYWSKHVHDESIQKNEHGSGSAIMYIPFFAGAPIFLCILIIELFKKGGFGMGKNFGKNE